MSVLARRHLSQCPIFAALIVRHGRFSVKPQARSPYEALVRSIAHQQLHGRAAEAILRRFVALFETMDPAANFPEPAHVLAAEEAALRGCGFSGSKIAAIRDICAKTLDGTVPNRRAAGRLSDGALIERLTTIRGVGRWTVEMVLISTLGRPDVLPVDDFGVREGYRILYGLEAQPKPRELATIGEAWAPWRSVAAWYLWRAADEGKKPKLVAG
jgi:DNA-3-methyladenine glycosylase II